MSNASFSSQFSKYLLISIVSVASLYLVQEGLRRRNFIYRFAEEAREAQSIPLDSTLVEVLLKKKTEFGKTVSFKSILEKNKKGLIVNFWATWCPPCIEELPSLELYSRQTKGKGELPKLILISVDEGLQPLQQLFSSLDFKPSFEVYLDRSGKLAQLVGSSKFPETYLVSPAGNVLLKWLGPQDWLSMEVLEKLRLAASSHSKS